MIMNQQPHRVKEITAPDRQTIAAHLAQMINSRQNEPQMMVGFRHYTPADRAFILESIQGLLNPESVFHVLPPILPVTTENEHQDLSQIIPFTEIIFGKYNAETDTDNLPHTQTEWN